jgi:polyhydroxybutyrate depolymerase
MAGRPRFFAVAAALVLVLALTGCRGGSTAASTSAPVSAPTVALPAGTSTGSLTVGGRARSYRVHRPAGLTGRAPLVVMLHGGFGSADQAEGAYGWDALADRAGFVVVYPDGVDRAWNVGGGCCGVPGRSGIDDTSFVSAVVARVRAGVPVDDRRVYATGISNGGMLAYRLACDTSLFAAIGADSATQLGACPSPRRISVIHLHGTADRNIPYPGGRGDGVAHIDGPAVPDVVAGWRRIDGCSAPTVTTVAAVTTSRAACPAGRAVELVTIAGAGHQWPGATSRPAVEKVLGLDPPSTALDATTTLWTFFAAHVRTD